MTMYEDVAFVFALNAMGPVYQSYGTVELGPSNIHNRIPKHTQNIYCNTDTVTIQATGDIQLSTAWLEVTI